MHSNTDRPLRDDVRLLGEILGKVIFRQEGERVFQLVERVRTLSKAARADDRFAGTGILLAKASPWTRGPNFQKASTYRAGTPTLFFKRRNLRPLAHFIRQNHSS
jgi:hypothetical protein